jgi:hypothetical protein
MEGVYLQAVIIRKPVSLEDAKRWSQFYIQNYKRTFYTENDEEYEFRNIFKNRFSCLKRKRINDVVLVVYGTIKDDDMQGMRLEERATPLSVIESDGRETRKEVPLQGLSAVLYSENEESSSGVVCSSAGLEA